ncbi:hypothetical protein TNCV_2161081 [Trichonephila clavipes]|nr:hypothetical protein TNCV_2161081 [Trichonephila clavipes]
MFNPVIHYLKRKLLSGIDVSRRRRSIEDDKNSVHPQIFRITENIEKIFVAVRKNRLQTTAESVWISSAAWQWALTKDLTFLECVAPRMLKEDQKANRIEMARGAYAPSAYAATWHNVISFSFFYLRTYSNVIEIGLFLCDLYRYIFL